MSIDISTLSAISGAHMHERRHSFHEDLSPSLGRMLREQEAIARHVPVLDFRKLAGIADPAQVFGLSPETLSQIDHIQSTSDAVQAFGRPLAAEMFLPSMSDQVRALGGPSAADQFLSQAERLQSDATKALGGSALIEAITSVREASWQLHGALVALAASASASFASALSQVRADELATWRTFMVEEESDWVEIAGAADDLQEAVPGESTEAGADQSAEDVAYGEILLVCGAARLRLRALAKRSDLVAFSHIENAGTEAYEVLVLSERFPHFAAELAAAGMPFLRLCKMLFAPAGGTRSGIEAFSQSQLLELAVAAQAFDDVLRQVERLIAS